MVNLYSSVLNVFFLECTISTIQLFLQSHLLLVKIDKILSDQILTISKKVFFKYTTDVFRLIYYLIRLIKKKNTSEDAARKTLRFKQDSSPYNCTFCLQKWSHWKQPNFDVAKMTFMTHDGFVFYYPSFHLSSVLEIKSATIKKAIVCKV